MYSSEVLTGQELVKAQLFLFDKESWEQSERLHPALPLSAKTRLVRVMEVKETIKRANNVGLIFEPPFAEDVLCYV